MVELIRCDNCGKEAPTEGIAGWFRLERWGIDVRSFGEEAGPWHFHSLKCLHEWSGGQPW